MRQMSSKTKALCDVDCPLTSRTPRRIVLDMNATQTDNVTAELIDAVDAIDFGDVDDYYPPQEAAEKAASWLRCDEAWTDSKWRIGYILQDAADGPLDDSDKRLIGNALASMRRIEVQWGASPSTDAIADLLAQVLQD